MRRFGVETVSADSVLTVKGSETVQFAIFESPADIFPVLLCIIIILDSGIISAMESHEFSLETISRIDPREVVSAAFPTPFGDFLIYGFRDSINNEEAVALVAGDLKGKTVLARIHSMCFTGDTLHSLRCDCGKQLHAAIQAIGENGTGILVYQMQEGRGIGLLNKLKAYALQDEGLDTIDANHKLGFRSDEREYAFCAEIFRYFGVKGVRMLTNNPRKIEGMEREGIQVVERVPLIIEPSEHNNRYLRTKKERMGHLI